MRRMSKLGTIPSSWNGQISRPHFSRDDGSGCASESEGESDCDQQNSSDRQRNDSREDQDYCID